MVSKDYNAPHSRKNSSHFASLLANCVSAIIPFIICGQLFITEIVWLYPLCNVKSINTKKCFGKKQTKTKHLPHAFFLMEVDMVEVSIIIEWLKKNFLYLSYISSQTMSPPPLHLLKRFLIKYLLHSVLWLYCFNVHGVKIYCWKIPVLSPLRT